MSELGAAPTSELSEFRAHARRIRYSVIQSVDGPRRRFLAPQAGGPMARKRGSGRRRKYQRGTVDIILTPGALAAKAVASQTVANSVETETWMSSVDLAWAYDGLVVDEGPISFGVAHSDYTAAEIESYIENSGSWDSGDLITAEIGRRKVRQVGTIALRSVSGDVNDGKSIRTKCGWLLLEDDTLQTWVYNHGAGALTTGGSVFATGHANLWPQ